jgi:hypothetical protein
MSGGLDAPVGPVDLRTAHRLTTPRAFKTPPAWVMVGDRAPQAIDARIYNDVIWILRRYHLRVTAAREPGNHTHGDGTAIDLVPADGITQHVWDGSAGRLAHDLGWTPECGTSEAGPRVRSCPRSSSSATTATPATAHRAPAARDAPLTSTSCGGPRATGAAPRPHHARG